MKYCPKCFKKYPLSVEKCADDGSYLVSPMDKDLVGEVLDDRYTVQERIGKGGMGVVYKAEQHLIKRIVALKVLRREIVQDETAVKRFLNEARAIASLDSKHTVSLYDFGVTRDGLLYYTMELLKGRPLSRIIHDEAPLDHVRAAGLLLQACRSLEEAHEHNILHRDLKPENLFVSAKKGKEQLKVLDFGIAKLLGDASMDTVTQAGMIVGTPQYLSPEQAKGNPLAPPSDLYSLGIVLYEMLAGKPPFLGDTPMKTLWAHIQDPVPPLRQMNPKVEVPRSIEAFLVKALEKEPSDRFQSAAAFADALRRAVEHHEASPETVSLPPLGTTGDGLRFRTPLWGAEEVPDLEGVPEAVEVADDGEEEAHGTALSEGTAALSTVNPEALTEAIEEFHTPPGAESKVQGPVEEMGNAETAWASEVPVGAPPAPVSPSKPEVSALESDPTEPDPEERGRVPSEAVVSLPMDAGGEAADGASAGTLSLAFPKRSFLIWGTGGLALLVVLVGMALWAPWDSEKELPEGKPVIAAAAEDQVSTPSGPSDRETSSPLADVHSVDIHEGTTPGPDVLTDIRTSPESPGAIETATTDINPDDPEVKLTVDASPPPVDVVREQETHLGDLRPAPEIGATVPPVDVSADAGEPADPGGSAEDDGARERAEKAERLAAEKAKERKAEERREAEKRAQAKARQEAEAQRKAEEAARREGDKKKTFKASQLVSQARQEMQKKRFDVALERLGDAASEGGETPEMRTLRGQCYAGIKAQEVSKHLAQARAALGSKDFDACIRAAGKAAKLSPGSGEASSLLKECQEKKDLEGMKFGF